MGSLRECFEQRTCRDYLVREVLDSEGWRGLMPLGTRRHICTRWTPWYATTLERYQQSCEAHIYSSGIRCGRCGELAVGARGFPGKVSFRYSPFQWSSDHAPRWDERRCATGPCHLHKWQTRNGAIVIRPTSPNAAAYGTGRSVAHTYRWLVRVWPTRAGDSQAERQMVAWLTRHIPDDQLDRHHYPRNPSSSYMDAVNYTNQFDTNTLLVAPSGLYRDHSDHGRAVAFSVQCNGTTWTDLPHRAPSELAEMDFGRHTLGFGSARHAVIVGIDGMDLRSLHSAIRQGRAPTLANLRRTGAYTDQCRVFYPSYSMANWAAILTGSGNTFTGISHNSYDIRQDTPPFTGYTGYIPSIMDVINAWNRLEALPPVDMGFFSSWQHLLFHFRRQDVTGADTTQWYTPSVHFRVINGTRQYCVDGETHSCQWHGQTWRGLLVDVDTVRDSLVTKHAADFIAQSKPKLVFLHYDQVDECGHCLYGGSSCTDAENPHHGGNITDCIWAVEKVDREIHQVITAYQRAGIYDKTIFIFVSDHGRDDKSHGMSHGGFSTHELTVQFLAHGAGVKQGHVITSAVGVDDVSPTILYALGIRQPGVWHGRPVKELFGKRTQEDAMQRLAEKFNVSVPVLIGTSFLALLGCFCLYLWICGPQDTEKDKEIEFKKLVEEVEGMIDVDTAREGSSDTDDVELQDIHFDDPVLSNELERMVR